MSGFLFGVLVGAIIGVVVGLAIRYLRPKYVVTVIEPAAPEAKGVSGQVERGERAEHAVRVKVVAQDERDAEKVAQKVAKEIDKANRKADKQAAKKGR